MKQTFVHVASPSKKSIHKNVKPTLCPNRKLKLDAIDNKETRDTVLVEAVIFSKGSHPSRVSLLLADVATLLILSWFP